jgi:hypothetical protein
VFFGALPPQFNFKLSVSFGLFIFKFCTILGEVHFLFSGLAAGPTFVRLHSNGRSLSLGDILRNSRSILAPMTPPPEAEMKKGGYMFLCLLLIANEMLSVIKKDVRHKSIG